MQDHVECNVPQIHIVPSPSQCLHAGFICHTHTHSSFLPYVTAYLQDGEEAFHGFHPIAVLLSYLTKAPLMPMGTPVVNALGKQRAMLENILRACVGLQPENNMSTVLDF